jgi:hypothetical protein
MPSTPQMRKANEKNAKNVTKRGNVTKSSKKDEGYPVSPELIVSRIFGNNLIGHTFRKCFALVTPS